MSRQSKTEQKKIELPRLGTCFLTGGSGFLGRALIKFLLEHNVGEVVALVRSDSAAEAAKKAGATRTVRGDLSSSVTTLAEAMKGCDYCFHLAAEVSPWWGKYRQIYDSNVNGTQRIIDACKTAGVKRLIHCSTEATLVAGPGGTLRNANESFPYGSNSSIYPYTSTKAEAERRVIAAGKAGKEHQLETVICRPRFIWGIGDTVVLARLVEANKKGQFAWFSEGRYLTSTVHVRNVCEGMILAAAKGRTGETYFLTDGNDVMVREWITRLLATQGVKPTEKSMSYTTAMVLGTVLEYTWWIFGCFMNRDSEPPLCRQVVKLVGEEVTVDDSKARRELGYTSHVTRDQGIEELMQNALPKD